MRDENTTMTTDLFAVPSQFTDAADTAPIAAGMASWPAAGQTAGVDPFGAPSTAVGGPRTTDHHRFPLPPRLREFETPRDRWGRYLLPNPITGKSEGGTRTTTLADTLDDTYNLHKWQIRSMIKGLKSNPDLLEDVDLYGEWRDINADIDKLTEKAMVAAGTAHGREYGTAVHEWLEVIDGGKLTVDDVPPEFRPKCDAYLATLRKHGIFPIANLVERIVRNEHRKTTGTFDRVYQLSDESLVIGDVKTAKDLGYSYMAISAQMAAYADAEYMLSEDGSEWLPMPEVRKDYAVILHVPSDEHDTVNVVTVDLEFGRRTLDYALAVRDLRTKAKKAVPGQWTLPEPETVPEDTAPNGMPAKAWEWLLDAVDNATSRDELGALWEGHQAWWTPELTERGAAALARVSASRMSGNPFL